MWYVVQCFRLITNIFTYKLKNILFNYRMNAVMHRQNKVTAITSRFRIKPVSINSTTRFIQFCFG